MENQVIREIAVYLETGEEQVAYWDDRLAEYFVRNTEEFRQFTTGNPVKRYNVWIDGLRIVKPGSNTA